MSITHQIVYVRSYDSADSSKCRTGSETDVSNDRGKLFGREYVNCTVR